MYETRGTKTQSEPIVPLLSRLGALFAKLAGEEAALAGAEIKRKLIALVIAIVLLAIAALVGVGILATITAALILAFSLVVAPWLAALIVTGIYAIVAIVLALVARSYIAKALPPVPTEALATTKENIAWAKRLITSKLR